MVEIATRHVKYFRQPHRETHYVMEGKLFSFFFFLLKNEKQNNNLTEKF